MCAAAVSVPPCSAPRHANGSPVLALGLGISEDCNLLYNVLARKWSLRPPIWFPSVSNDAGIK